MMTIRTQEASSSLPPLEPPFWYVYIYESVQMANSSYKDLTQSGVQIEPFFIATPEKPFEPSKFYSVRSVFTSFHAWLMFLKVCFVAKRIE
jgi:hypothetical protein